MPSIYATVGSNRLEAAKAFYDALLALIGLEPKFDHPSGGRVYGAAGAPEHDFCFAVLGPYNRETASIGNGSMAAFRLDTPQQVDAFHALALELGARDEGAPGWRAPIYYMSYCRDLDGNKLAAFCVDPDRR